MVLQNRGPMVLKTDSLIESVLKQVNCSRSSEPRTKLLLIETLKTLVQRLGEAGKSVQPLVRDDLGNDLPEKGPNIGGTSQERS